MEEHHGKVFSDPLTKFGGAYLIKHYFRNFPRMMLYSLCVRARGSLPREEDMRRGVKKGTSTPIMR